MKIRRWFFWTGGAAVVLVGAAGMAMRWLQRPMFEPGSVARRVAASGGSLAPPGPSQGPLWSVAPGVQLYHFAVGAGPEVVAVHGGPGMPPAEPWAGARLTGHRWHFYHQRGCGRSSRPIERLAGDSTYADMQALEATLGLTEQIADLERIRRILGRDRLTLVGHSFGALVAALYAAEFPDRVQALVLVAPAPLFVMPIEGGDLFRRVGARLPPERRADYRRYLDEYFDFRARLRSSEAELSTFYSRFKEFYALASEQKVGPADASAGGWVVLASFLSLGRRHDWRPALARIRAPVLVVHGTRDLQPLAQTRQVAAAIPGARLVQIEGAGHFPFDQAPQAFARELSRFLDGAPGAGREVLAR